MLLRQSKNKGAFSTIPHFYVEVQNLPCVTPVIFLSETVPGNVLNYSANAQMHPCAPAREIRVLVLLRSSDARRRVPT